SETIARTIHSHPRLFCSKLHPWFRARRQIHSSANRDQRRNALQAFLLPVRFLPVFSPSSRVSTREQFSAKAHHWNQNCPVFQGCLRMVVWLCFSQMPTRLLRLVPPPLHRFSLSSRSRCPS